MKRMLGFVVSLCINELELNIFHMIYHRFCFLLTGPKTYSLNTNTQTDTSGVSDKSILKVGVLLFDCFIFRLSCTHPHDFYSAEHQRSLKQYLSCRPSILMLCLHFLKVVIQPELEKKVIKLINDYRQEYADKGPISGRLTTKKLLVINSCHLFVWPWLC